MALLMSEGRKSIANLEMAMFLNRKPPPPHPLSPTPSRGWTEGDGVEGMISKYDNHRPLEVTCASTIGSHRLSFATSYSNLDSLDGPLTENMLQAGFKGSITELNVPVHHLQLHAQRNSLLGKDEKPDNFFRLCKYYYDHYRCRNFAPFILLFLYAIIGAYLFHLLECDNEKRLIGREQSDLDSLRNSTFTKFFRSVNNGGNDRLDKARTILLSYEKELDKIRLPNRMNWDMWGAMFYVGALVTTIGYGNIAPRTWGGQALSVGYAMIGIPLVLAILSQFGRVLTNVVSEWWQKYRQRVKRVRRMWKEKGESVEKKEGEEMLRSTTFQDLESGFRSLVSFSEDNSELEEIEESRTIPIWLALLICVGWICTCAGIFCIWETRWTYGTSLYFFFISLSTIGLGDVVPDHPHMLILMFWLVIIGLSIVSMLLSVIQIKMEEWLYNLMIRMQKEYQRALETGESMDKSEILEKMFDKQPWFMRNFGPQLMNEKQADAIEKKAEQYDRVLRDVNNKNCQTDDPLTTVNQTQWEGSEQKSMGCDPKTQTPITERKVGFQETQWTSQHFTSCNENPIPNGKTIHRTESGSSDECTTLPPDSISLSVVSKCAQTSLVHNMSKDVQTTNQEDVCLSDKAELDNDRWGTPSRELKVPCCEMEVQTEIAQFQIDEIVLRLHSIQKERSKPVTKDSAMETSITIPLLELMEEKGTQYDIGPALMDRGVLTDLLSVLTRSAETQSNRTVDSGVCTESDFTKDKCLSTDPSLGMWNRGTQAMKREQTDGTTDTGDSLAENVQKRSIGLLTEERESMGRETQMERIEMKDSCTLTDSAIGMSRSGSDPNSNEMISIGIQNMPKMKERSMCTEPPCRFSRSVETDEVRVPRETRETQCTTNTQDEGTDSRGVVTNDTKETQYDTPDSEDRSMITDPPPSMNNQSIITESCVPSTSIHTQTGEGESVPLLRVFPATYDISYSSSVLVEMSTQCSPPPDSPTLKKDSLQARGRALSWNGSTNEKLDTTEVIIQTDDSYLKIARRLDDYRSNNNRNSFLPVMAAHPLTPGQRVIDESPNRPSERRPYSLDINSSNRRNSATKKVGRRKMGKLQAMFEPARSGGSSSDDEADDSKSEEGGRSPPTDKKSRSSSPGKKSLRGVLTRKASLPPGIPRGRVSDYVALHEKGISNPATNTRKPVQIIRQLSMCED